MIAATDLVHAAAPEPANERPEPHAGESSVHIRVQATSVNPIDVILRADCLQPYLPLDLPAIPGRDAVGVVDEVGRGVRGVMVVEVVFGLGGVSDTTAAFTVLTAQYSCAPRT
nr:alcohol dehydrogenase catalytic domain-containing protein [Rathayibacter sp. AY1C2]